MTLKQKTITGLIWSFIDSIAGQGITFIVGIFLARVLGPKEFGLIGMLTIFIAISQSFIDSGFRQALIRKQDCTNVDYSTVFYFNIIVGILFYIILYLCAPSIAAFFKEPILKDLIKILGLGLIINSFTIIQSTLLTKRIDFKLQAKISAIAAVISGIISISMAYSGWGVWSLVALTLVRYTINSFFLWLWSKWKPIWHYSQKSFNGLFSFGSKLLISGLIETIYRNVYYLIIGKYFSAVELGYYTQADQLQSLPSSNLTGIIGKVSFPVLSSFQNDIPQLKNAYERIIRSTMLITFVLMLGLAATARPMILTLIGEKWEPSIIYLQMLCFIGMFYPLHSINLSILQVQGRSDLFLRLEIIKKILAIPIIFIAIFFGIKAMIIGIMILSFTAYYLNSYWSGKMIDYPFTKQVKDIIPSFIIALIVNGFVFSLNFLGITTSIILLLCQIAVGTFLTILICEGIKFEDYIYIKNIALEKLFKLNMNEKNK